MRNSECLRLNHTGSCGGCNILVIAEKIDPGTKPAEAVITRLAKNYCPEGERPVLPQRPKPSIW